MTEANPDRTDPSDGTRVVRLIGVYHASGTTWGELSYWLKARVGVGHCALCDITHGTFREKSEWQQCRLQLPVELVTVHLDERDDRLAAFTEGRTPCIVAETADDLVMLVDAAELRSCDGSPDRLIAAIEQHSATHGLVLG
jgi:hypothetical protein